MLVFSLNKSVEQNAVLHSPFMGMSIAHFSMVSSLALSLFLFTVASYWIKRADKLRENRRVVGDNVVNVHRFRKNNKGKWIRPRVLPHFF